MTTPDINAQRLDILTGPVATELVAITRNHLRRRRLVAIGRSVAGRGFVVTTGGAATVQAPADFAEAVAEVDSKPAQTWPAAEYMPLSDEPGYSESLTPYFY